jgi:hypothetical protein
LYKRISHGQNVTWTRPVVGGLAYTLQLSVFVVRGQGKGKAVPVSCISRPVQPPIHALTRAGAQRGGRNVRQRRQRQLMANCGPDSGPIRLDVVFDATWLQFSASDGIGSYAAYSIPGTGNRRAVVGGSLAALQRHSERLRLCADQYSPRVAGGNQAHQLIVVPTRNYIRQ